LRETRAIPTLRTDVGGYLFLVVAALISLAALLVARTRVRLLERLVAYCLFFTTPLLTSLGVVGVLTGMSENPTAPSPLFGISFYSLYLALHLHANAEGMRQHPAQFLLQAINPTYFFTGPVPFFTWKNDLFAKGWRRAKVVHNDLLHGILFAVVLAPSLTPYLTLRSSVNAIDILSFGIAYEVYVYLNFCGYSTMAWAALRLLGIRVPRNFRQPFGAASVVEYWRRWHVSLGGVLKVLFFAKIRPAYGVVPAVTVVFLASALWHGVTVNFVVWGLFHAAMWLVAYRLRKWRFFNFLLLAFTIVIGRIIFAEADQGVLFEKARALTTASRWQFPSGATFLPPSWRERINLAVCVILLATEVLLGRVRPQVQQYQYLKGRLGSALVAGYLCLFLADPGGGPVYGDR
jgi:alginate O-acetyltransferase complex protein AlgI